MPKNGIYTSIGVCHWSSSLVVSWEIAFDALILSVSIIPCKSRICGLVSAIMLIYRLLFQRQTILVGRGWYAK